MTPAIRYTKKLTDFEKILFSELCSMSQLDDSCQPTNNYLAACFSKSDRSIQYGISKMKKIGIISTDLQFDSNGTVVSRKISITKNYEQLLKSSILGIFRDYQQRIPYHYIVDKDGFVVVKDADVYVYGKAKIRAYKSVIYGFNEMTVELFDGSKFIDGRAVTKDG
jgi:hypothetical protein